MMADETLMIHPLGMASVKNIRIKMGLALYQSMFSWQLFSMSKMSPALKASCRTPFGSTQDLRKFKILARRKSVTASSLDVVSSTGNTVECIKVKLSGSNQCH